MEYFVTKRPGYYGTITLVKSSHRTIEAAFRKVGKDKSLCVRKGGLTKGEEFNSSFEQVYPMVIKNK